jgi:hypothetical protein
MFRPGRTVYLLGAGASREAGVPLTAEILPAASQLLQEASHLEREHAAGRWWAPDYSIAMETPVEQIGVSKEGKIFRLIIEDVLTLWDALNRIGNRRVPLDIEEVASALDDSTTLQILADLGWTDDRLTGIRRGVDFVLYYLLMGARMRNGPVLDFNRDLRVFQRFAKLIRPRQDVILTLNYDYQLEHAMGSFDNWNDQRREFEYKGIDFGIPIVIDAPRSNSNAHRILHGSIMLLHLHGSLSWLFCENCHLVRSTIDPWGFGDGWQLTPEMLASPTVAAGHRNYALCVCGARANLLVVSPALLKRYDNIVIEKIWKLARAALASAVNIICIGCSLRDSDRDLVELLRSTCGPPANEKNVVFVTRGDPMASARATSIFGRYTLFDSGFGDYLESRGV